MAIIELEPDEFRRVYKGEKPRSRWSWINPRNWAERALYHKGNSSVRHEAGNTHGVDHWCAKMGRQPGSNARAKAG